MGKSRTSMIHGMQPASTQCCVDRRPARVSDCCSTARLLCFAETAGIERSREGALVTLGNQRGRADKRHISRSNPSRRRTRGPRTARTVGACTLEGGVFLRRLERNRVLCAARLLVDVSRLRTHPEVLAWPADPSSTRARGYLRSAAGASCRQDGDRGYHHALTLHSIPLAR